MFAMAIMTLIVLPFIFFSRIRAIQSKDVDVSAFELNDLEQIPKKLQQHSRHLSNLFEVPVLFYVACLAILTLGIDDNIFITQGWLYFLLRAAHSFIHLSYNNVRHRVIPFALSNVVLVTIWLRIILIA